MVSWSGAGSRRDREGRREGKARMLPAVDTASVRGTPFRSEEKVTVLASGKNLEPVKQMRL